jgi:hypothetical protein
MTRITRFFALTFALVLATALGFSARQAPVQAQEEMMTHTCDSTLILLLYIAEHDYGFQSMMDVSTFEKGQYAPWFEAMMAMMDEEMMEMDEEEMAMDEEMMEMDDSDMMMEGMVMLTPAVIADEDEACTALRAEIEAYLYETISAEMMMMEESEG